MRQHATRTQLKLNSCTGSRTACNAKLEHTTLPNTSPLPTCAQVTVTYNCRFRRFQDRRILIPNSTTTQLGTHTWLGGSVNELQAGTEGPSHISADLSIDGQAKLSTKDFFQRGLGPPQQRTASQTNLCLPSFQLERSRFATSHQFIPKIFDRPCSKLRTQFPFDVASCGHESQLQHFS